MLNLLQRDLEVKLVYKVTSRHTAQQSEACKLSRFKFPFNDKLNGSWRFINFLVGDTGNRIEDYPVVHSVGAIDMQYCVVEELGTTASSQSSTR